MHTLYSRTTSNVLPTPLLHASHFTCLTLVFGMVLNGFINIKRQAYISACNAFSAYLSE